MAAEECEEDAVFLSPLPSFSRSNGINGSKSLHRQQHNNNNNNHFHRGEYAQFGVGVTAPAAATTSDSSSHEGHHQPEHQHRSFYENIFSSHSYHGDNLGHQVHGPGHGYELSGSQAYLAPPPNYDMGRRRSSNSSLESFSHNLRRRGSYRGSSASHFSDVLDEENADAATLMTYMRSIGHAFKHTRKVLRRVFQAVFVTRRQKPKVVCEAEVMEQVGWVCKDYIVARLIARDLMTRKTGITPSNWPQSRHVIAAGSALEALYPRTYSNVSRKLCLTMSSPKLVRNTLLAVLEVLFEGSITWAKVVSMMAIAGLYAEECSSQGHPDFVHEVVDAVLDFTGAHLLRWLVAQGGWDCFPLPEGSEGNRLSMFRLLLVSGVTTIIFCVRYYLLNYSYSNQET